MEIVKDKGNQRDSPVSFSNLKQGKTQAAGPNVETFQQLFCKANKKIQDYSDLIGLFVVFKKQQMKVTISKFELLHVQNLYRHNESITDILLSTRL